VPRWRRLKGEAPYQSFLSYGREVFNSARLRVGGRRARSVAGLAAKFVTNEERLAQHRACLWANRGSVEQAQFIRRERTSKRDQSQPIRPEPGLQLGTLLHAAKEGGSRDYLPRRLGSGRPRQSAEGSTRGEESEDHFENLDALRD